MPEENRDKAALTSWKEIAGFLGVNIRTAQRWAAQKGLPVRRFPSATGRATADPAELLEWKRQTIKGGPRWSDTRFLQRYAVVASALLFLIAAGLGAFWLINARGPPAAARPELQTLVVTDERGRELWRKEFRHALAQDAYRGQLSGRTSWVGDIDGDSDAEVIFVYHPLTPDPPPSTVYCYGRKGDLKWTFVPGQEVADNTQTYSRAFAITDFAVSDLGPGIGLRVLVTSHHLTYHPNQFAMLDGGGKAVAEYWHSGHLDGLAAADLDGDGLREILLCGVNNGLGAATLVVLDPRRAGGASTVAGDSSMQLRGFPPAQEKAVLTFPRTCVNRIFDLYNIAKRVRAEPSGIEIHVQEKLDDISAVVIYTLDRRLKVLRVLPSDRIKALHQQLEREGRLNHSLDGRELERLGKLELRRGFK